MTLNKMRDLMSLSYRSGVVLEFEKFAKHMGYINLFDLIKKEDGWDIDIHTFAVNTGFIDNNGKFWDSK